MKRDLKILQGIHTTGCFFAVKCGFRTHSSATKCITLWETRRAHPELQPKQQERLHDWVMKHICIISLIRSLSLRWSSKTDTIRAACKHTAYAAGNEPRLGLWTLTTSGEKLPRDIWLLGPIKAVSGNWKTVGCQIGWWSQSSSW